MVSFVPEDVTEVVQTSINVDDITQNFTRAQNNFVFIQRCLAALDPTGPPGPQLPDGTSSGIPLKFLTQADENGVQRIVQADISSTTAFQQSLEGITIDAGDAVIASVSNPNAFGTSVGKGDALFSKVNNPTQDITNTSDWLRLEGDDSYSVTLSERMLLNTANEEDTPVRIVDSSTEVTVTFYLLSAEATVDGDLTGGQTGSFTQTTAAPRNFLYVRIPAIYASSQGADNLYVEVTDANGTVVSFQKLSTYKERTDLLVGGDDVFESDNTGQTPPTAIGYAANQTVRLWRTRLSRTWYFPESLDVIRSVPDGGIPITKLGESTQTLLRSLQTHIIDNQATLASLESKIDALFPLTPDVTTLNEWADIYDPDASTETVTIARGYSLLADFRGVAAADHYESAGVTFTDGTDVAQYSGLSNDLHRAFGFRVSGASDQILLWINDGGTLIPFFDITSGGNLRVNDFTPARTEDQEVTGDFRAVTSPSTGTGTLTIGGAASTYTMPGYPSGTTNQTRTADITFDVLVNGSDTGAGGGIGIEIPNTLLAQSSRTVDHTFFLGFPSNRTVTATFRYEFRVSGSDLLLDVELENAPSDVTFTVDNVALSLSYTASIVIARVDNFLSFGDGLGTFTFSGDHEFLFAFHPVPNQNTTDVVPVAINTSTGVITELNDILIKDPEPGFDSIEVPDTIEFRTFLPDHFLIHRDLSHLLSNRTDKWVYNLADLNEISVHEVTEAIDLASGSTLNGTAIGITDREVVHQATGTGTGMGELIQNVVLPVDYADFQYLHVTEYITGAIPEWRSVLIDVALLTSGDVGASELIRIQGNSDFTWSSVSRALVSQAGQTIWRSVLLSI